MELRLLSEQTITALNGTVRLSGSPTAGASGLPDSQAVSVQIYGTFTGTLQIQVKNSVAAPWFALGSAVAGTGATNEMVDIVGVYAFARIEATAWTSGTATIVAVTELPR